jgi:hypothetical protein
MCAGNGKRWGDYLGIPKHFVIINGETLIGRTTRLLKEYGINDYLITTSDERYKQYGQTRPQTNNDCEIDRYEEIEDNEICYLYGDVYYTEEALRTIINTPTDEILFFGSEMEIFGVKIKNKKLFFKHKNRVKKLYLDSKIDRCIGWEVYKSINNLPLNEYAITDRFVLIDDETDDIDYPYNYLEIIDKLEGGIKMIKVEAIQQFTLGRFNEISNLIRKRTEVPGTIFTGDTFECSKELAEYLTGKNDKGVVVVKVIEVIPNEVITSGYCAEVIEKPIKKATKKKTGKK